MDMTYKIARFMWVSLIVAAVFLFTMDFGKVYVADSKNYYVANNSASYVTKFGLNVTDLSEFEETGAGLDEVKDALLEYFDLQYTNMGYERTSLGGDSVDVSQFKAVYEPKAQGYDEMWMGPIFVRAKLYGFDGAPPSPIGGENALIRVNIEQKIPAGMRNFMKINGVNLSTVENPTDGTDYEGFWGYYSVVSEHAFSINIVQ